MSQPVLHPWSDPDRETYSSPAAEVSHLCVRFEWDLWQNSRWIIKQYASSDPNTDRPDIGALVDI